MATQEDLCESGQLERIDGLLDEHELSWRRVYATPDFIDWLENSLPSIPHEQMYSDMSPLEQVAALFSEYIAGEDFATDRRFRKLRRTPSLDIWELKTDDVRVFGWVPEKDVFICCFGDSATEIKVKDLYGRYMAQSSLVMRDLRLDDPKAVISGSYSDVISTKN